MMETKIPVLYPVACFITGTTPNGGGIWKYVLHASSHGLLRRNLPVLTQVLHFLDFSVSPTMLKNRWRKPLRESYNGNFQLSYQASIFADSGGFTLMFDPDLDLSAYGIFSENLAEGILKLQIDLGANFVASLDYPIPPNLGKSEVERRMAATKSNALKVARYLVTISESKRPQLFIPIHGPTPEALNYFVRDLLAQLKAEGLESLSSGLALGSMVPLRKAHRTEEILSFTRSARAAMPSEMPLHVFGVTGLLTPFLIAEGATSFDTSGYIQNARNLKYIDPKTRQSIPFRSLVGYPCTCLICRDRDFYNDLALLEGKREGQKSETYAAIALHNLEQDFQLLANANLAQSSNELPDFLHSLGARFNTAQRLLTALEETDSKIKKGKQNTTTLIQLHKPEDFDIRQEYHTYKPSKSTCLILPCSQEKPYPSSQSFKYVWKKLQESLGKTTLEDIEVIFLSGLYGPVPMELTEEEAVKTYDFFLHSHDQAGIARVAERLADFLQKHGMHFKLVLTYVTIPAYRKAIELAMRSYSNLVVLPRTQRKGQLAFYKQDNIQQLIENLQLSLRDHNSSSDEKIG